MTIPDPTWILKVLSMKEKSFSWDNLSSYVFWLQTKKLPTSYNFYCYPLPISEELNDHLYELNRAGMVSLDNDEVSLTSEGREYIGSKDFSGKPVIEVRSDLEIISSKKGSELMKSVYQAS
ncbi:MAG: hypothetical protein GOU97_04915 [Nanoarchaeota archaeon]|nr:hypothetical protein [Nanoarchaeota archaeon]